MGDPTFLGDSKTCGFSLTSTICVLEILECRVGYFLVAWYSQRRSTPALQILLLDSASPRVSCNHKPYFRLILIESCVPSDGHFRICCWESMQMLYGRSPCEPFTTAFNMRHLWGGLDSSRGASETCRVLKLEYRNSFHTSLKHKHNCQLCNTRKLNC